jgi:hypothetical protein
LTTAVETAFYYFFSTLAQTLGGIAALFGAVVLFRMQTLWEQARRAAEYLNDYFQHPDASERTRMQEYWANGNLRGVLAQSENQPAHVGGAERYARARTTLTAIISHEEELRVRFWTALGITAALVVVSIGFIPLGPTGIVRDSWLWMVFAGFTVWLIACLWFYGRVLASAFTSPFVLSERKN